MITLYLLNIRLIETWLFNKQFSNCTHFHCWPIYIPIFTYIRKLLERPISGINIYLPVHCYIGLHAIPSKIKEHAEAAF